MRSISRSIDLPSVFSCPSFSGHCIVLDINRPREGWILMFCSGMRRNSTNCFLWINNDFIPRCVCFIGLFEPVLVDLNKYQNHPPNASPNKDWHCTFDLTMMLDLCSKYQEMIDTQSAWQCGRKACPPPCWCDPWCHLHKANLTKVQVATKLRRKKSLWRRSSWKNHGRFETCSWKLSWNMFDVQNPMLRVSRTSCIFLRLKSERQLVGN